MEQMYARHIDIMVYVSTPYVGKASQKMVATKKYANDAHEMSV